MAKNVSLRLGMEGKQEIKSGFEEIGAAGDAAAKRAAGAFERAAADIAAANQRQEQAAQKLAAFRPDVRVSTERAGPSTSLFRDYQRDMQQLERQAEAVRNAIDPLRVAQKRYDDEVAIASRALAANKISEEEHAHAVALSTSALERARAEMGRGVANDNARKVAIQNLGFQFQDFAVQVTGGTSVFRAFSQQFPQAVGAMTGFSGKIGAIGAFLNGPWGIALTLATVLASGFADKLIGGASAADEMAAHQKSLAAIVDQTTGRINEQSRALVLNQAALTRKDAKQAETDASAARRKILAQGGQFISEGGIEYSNDPRIVAAIRNFGKDGSSNRLAQTLNAIATAAPKLKPATDEIVAQAAAFVEADRKAQQYQAQIRLLTGAAKPGDRRVALGQFGAEKPDLSLIEARAKLAAATNGQERAQARLTIVQLEGRKAVEEGTKSEALYQRELTVANSAVHAADAANKALSASHREAAKDARAAQKAALDYAKGIASVSGDLARAAAEGGAKVKALFATDFTDVQSKLADEQKDRLAPSSYALQQIVAQRESLRLSQGELDTIRMGSDTRQLALDKLRATIDLERENVALTSDEAKERLAGIDAQDALRRAIERSGAAMDEVRGFVGSLVDNLAAGRDISKDLLAEFIKLAAVNPLKNLINGNNALPSLGSIFSLFGSKGAALPSSASLDFSGALAATRVTVPGFAGGTDSAPGGLAWVAENGPELIRLPRGASVTPAAQTRRILSSNDNGGALTIHVDARGASDPAEVEAAVARGIAAAAPGIANAGADIARMNDMKRARHFIRR